ncbi:NmrA family NAD(P)-binding protein [Nocardia sp. alder85J]|uniref:NmrA family NAD(P)-binding protein n=1 Tax=Nocardia sp. alder85J TaxID=2862949 RepID=UPI001CD45694|nr:NmrA family NAD(P)-binding protein [Nocardia sp. alder85J]MCX4091747.1 NmrA family NAD(P)-binding protein [Nocardia sp. alder85J]
MFLVTGANGELFGRPVLDQLRRLAPEADIVAGTRDPGSAAGLAATGVRVRRVDFDDPASLASAFEGATSVLINGTNYGTPAERRAGQHAVAIRAAVEAGVGRIVYTSWPDPDLYPLPIMSDFVESEALLRSLSADATIVRTTYGLAHTVGRDVTTAMASGTLAAPAGRARTAPAHIDDLAEATARVLVSDEHRGNLYTLTASDSIDWTDLAALAAATTGKPIDYRPVTDDEFAATVAAQGFPADLVDILLGVYRAFRAGWTSTPTDDLATILRRPPKRAAEAVAAVITA